jgi:molybdopterin synthase catalytic subunit
MTLNEVFQIAQEHFPLCHVGEDSEGEVIIFTGMVRNENSMSELREMTDEDIA